MATKAKITKAYMEFELMEGRAPHSVFELCKKIKIEEEAFYKLFSSLASVQEEILAEFLTRTQEIVDKDPEYPNYNAREKT
jgi:hypothetical protein